MCGRSIWELTFQVRSSFQQPSKPSTYFLQIPTIKLSRQAWEWSAQLILASWKGTEHRNPLCSSGNQTMAIGTICERAVLSSLAITRRLQILGRILFMYQAEVLWEDTEGLWVGVKYKDFQQQAVLLPPTAVKSCVYKNMGPIRECCITLGRCLGSMVNFVSNGVLVTQD